MSGFQIRSDKISDTIDCSEINVAIANIGSLTAENFTGNTINKVETYSINTTQTLPTQIHQTIINSNPTTPITLTVPTLQDILAEYPGVEVNSSILFIINNASTSVISVNTGPEITEGTLLNANPSFISQYMIIVDSQTTGTIYKISIL